MIDHEREHERNEGEDVPDLADAIETNERAAEDAEQMAGEKARARKDPADETLFEVLRRLPAHAILTLQEAACVARAGVGRVVAALKAGILRGAYIGGRKGWSVVYGDVSSWISAGALTKRERAAANAIDATTPLAYSAPLVDQRGQPAMMAMVIDYAQARHIAPTDPVAAGEDEDVGSAEGDPIDEGELAAFVPAPSEAMDHEQMRMVDTSRLKGVAIASANESSEAGAQGQLGVMTRSRLDPSKEQLVRARLLREIGTLEPASGDHVADSAAPLSGDDDDMLAALEREIG